MAMGIVPVAMSLEVAYSVLPSMIYDEKRRGESLTSPFALLHFSISSKEFFWGIGLTQQLHTSGLEIQRGPFQANKSLKERHGNGKGKRDAAKDGKYP